MFTPGPWRVINKKYPGIDSESHCSIIIYGERNEESGVRGDSPDEIKANARLISAAPDMYEALKLARTAIEKDIEDADVHGWTATERAPYIAAINAIDAALAKAGATHD